MFRRRRADDSRFSLTGVDAMPKRALNDDLKAAMAMGKYYTFPSWEGVQERDSTVGQFPTGHGVLVPSNLRWSFWFRSRPAAYADPQLFDLPKFVQERRDATDPESDKARY